MDKRRKTSGKYSKEGREVEVMVLSVNTAE
jgi:hypothetical protein